MLASAWQNLQPPGLQPVRRTLFLFDFISNLCILQCIPSSLFYSIFDSLHLFYSFTEINYKSKVAQVQGSISMGLQAK
jgi:hypothetical protein